MLLKGLAHRIPTDFAFTSSRKILIGALILIILLARQAANAATYTTVQAGDWDDASTWDCISPPLPACQTTPPSQPTGANTININHGIPTNPTFLMDGNTLEINGTVNVNRAVFETEKDVQVLAGGALNINSGNLILNDGNLQVLQGAELNSNDSYIFAANGDLQNTGTTIFPDTCIDLENGNFQNQNQGSLSGSGFLNLDNGNIEVLGGTVDFQAWCAANGNYVPAPPPQPENCGFVATACNALTTFIDYGDAPDSNYQTTESNNGAAHYRTGPYLGTNSPDSEADGKTNTDATGDDITDDGDPDTFDGIDDEDGIASFPTVSTVDAIYTVSGINATNNTGSAAILCSWFDFEQNNSFNNNPNTSTAHPAKAMMTLSDAGERSCIQVPTGTGSYDLSWTIPNQHRRRSGDFIFRFRITTSPEFFTANSPSFFGLVNDGEVEDYQVPITALPVTLNHFNSQRTNNKVNFDWGTSSELFNVGFQLWGLDGVDGQWEKLHNWLIRSGSGNAVEPQSYTKRVRIPTSIDQLVSVGISSVDSDGSEHYYGPFELGVSYGELGDLAPIVWDDVRAELDTRMAAQGYTKSGVNGYRKVSSTSTLALSNTDNESVIEFRVSTPGVYRIAGSELPQEWHSAPKGELAVLDYQGNGVVRHVQAKGQGSGSTRALGAAGSIYFYSEGVNETQRLYSEAKVYRLVLDSARALNAPIQSKQGVTSGWSDSYREVSIVEEDESYIFHSAVDDPWLDEVVIGFSDKLRVRRQPVPVEADLLIEDSATLLLGLGRSSALGAIDLDSDGVQDAEHIVTGTVTDAEGVKVKLDPVSAVGSGRWDLALPIPAGTLLGDANGIVNSGAFFNAGEGYAFSEVHIDSIGLEYSRPYVSKVGEDHLLFRGPDTGELGYSVTVPDTGWPWVFASDGSNLVRIGLESQAQGNG